MRYIHLTSVLIVSAIAQQVFAGSPDLSAENLTIGRNLQGYTSIRLAKPAPADDFQITVTSDDPGRLLLAKASDQKGVASISLNIPAKSVRTAEFSLFALGDKGSATYTISAPGMESGKGTVNLTKSGIVIVGPHKASTFPTTPRAEGGQVTIVSAALDSEGKIIEEQPVGTDVEVQINNSNPAVAQMGQSKVILAAGTSTIGTFVRPSAVGNAIIAPAPPSGFSVSTDRASITVAVAEPGLAISGDFYIGKDLQTSGSIILGEPTPPGGLKVTLKSADPAKLLLSPKPDEVGSGTIVLTIPEGERTASYILQALGDSGIVEYTATAPGFHSKPAPIGLAKAGVILAYEGYGPPDEGNVKRKIGRQNNREFFVSLADSKLHPVRLVVFSAYLDPETGRAADFTVQSLRAGVTATVDLTSSEPEVATIDPTVTIKPGYNSALLMFNPTHAGKTLISVSTPAGFSAPQNAVAVPATVRE